MTVSSDDLDATEIKQEQQKDKKQQQKKKLKKPPPPATRFVELCVISAQDLKNVSRMGTMRTYAVAYVSSSIKGCKASTGVDLEGGTNPTWDDKLCIELEEELLQDPSTQLTIDIFHRSRGRLKRDKLVGSVRILLHDALHSDSRINRFPVASYLVFRPSGDPQGMLNVCIPPGGRFPDRLGSLSFKGLESAVSGSGLFRLDSGISDASVS